MLYKCIKEMYLPKCDADGFEIHPHNFTGQMAEDFEWVLSLLK